MFAAEAKRRQGNPGQPRTATVREISHQRSGRSAEQAGVAVGVSGWAVRSAEKIARTGGLMNHQTLNDEAPAHSDHSQGGGFVLSVSSTQRQSDALSASSRSLTARNACMEGSRWGCHHESTSSAASGS